MALPDPDSGADSEIGETGRQLADARPTVDHAAMEDVRSRAEAGLFGSAAPPRLGRFVLLKQIAGGGMGMIHRAYDPQLERAVALKVLHPGLRRHDPDRGRARLLVEARALARLAHPNVVPVHDVVEIEGQVVVVMELVEGKTLAAWQREQPRSWRDTVSIYLQAGRGLAAAHALGIVHRDFKPANAIVGDDGRVRVLDFGLARFTAHGESAPSAPRPGDRDDGFAEPSSTPPAGATAPALTASGEVLGTLAYMAPEQLMGDTATAASDQFSFCVSLHLALFGVRPFAGQDPVSLLASMSAGRIDANPDARVPSALRVVVSRGLAVVPEQRHRSMLALLDELGRERGWRRWRWAALAAAMLTAAIVAATIAGGARDPLAACTGGRDEIDPVWNAARGQRIRDALVQIGTPYARAVDGRILAALDGYRDRWSAMHRTACREYRSVRLSADRFDRRMQCLGRRLQDLATTVVLLEGIDAGSVTGAVDTATRLPPVEPCAEIDALADGDEPPATAADRAQAFAIREQLSLAGALERAGRSDDALVAAERALTAAQRLSYPPVVLEAAQIKGSVLVFRGDFAEAVAPLALAEQLALEQRRLGAAVAAGARRIYADGMRGEKLDRLAGQIDVLELLSRSPLEDRSARPLLLNYVGAVYMARDDRAQARRHFEAARAAFAGPVPADSELMSIDMNLAMLTPDRATREALARAAWQRFKDQLGPQHLTTLSEQCRYAHYVVDPAVARSLLREAGELYRAFHADVLRDRSSCMSYEAFLAAELDERDTAGALYAEIAAMAKRSTDEDVASRGRLAEGYVALYGGAPSAAIASFAAVIAAFARSPHWWDHQLAAEAELGAGLAEAALGRPRSAATHLERAVATLGGLVPRNEDAENRQRLALAKLHLARALRASQAPASESRARDLEAQASAFYREASPGAYRRRLETLR